jgi:hypothetical protein
MKKIFVVLTLALTTNLCQAADREFAGIADPLAEIYKPIATLPACTSENLKNTPDADKKKDGCFCKNINSYDYQAGITYDFCKLTHDPSITPCCWQGKTP